MEAGGREWEAEQLVTGRMTKVPRSWSHNGVLAYDESGDIWVLSLEGEREPHQFLENEFRERFPKFSPDAQWIAFTSDRSGREEVYVTSYPDKGGIIQVSAEGGSTTAWAPNGKELFYQNGNKIMVVSIQTEPTFKAETPRLLFEGSFELSSPNFRDWDISPDGQRFVMLQTDDQEQLSSTQLTVVLNWFEELKRLVPTDN